MVEKLRRRELVIVTPEIVGGTLVGRPGVMAKISCLDS